MSLCGAKKYRLWANFEGSLGCPFSHPLLSYRKLSRDCSRNVPCYGLHDKKSSWASAKESQLMA